MSAEATRDRRAHRVAWCIALGLFIPIATTIAVVAFWPLPSPKPHRERALALMQGSHSDLDLQRGKQATIALASLHADMRAIQGDIIANQPAPPPYADGAPRKWCADPSVLIGGGYLDHEADAIDLALARHALQRYEQAGYWDRARAILNSPLLWIEMDPKAPMLRNVNKLVDAGSSVRSLTRDVTANLKITAEAGDIDTTRQCVRDALAFANLPCRNSTLFGYLVANASRAVVIEQTARLAVNPDVRTEVLAAMLTEFNNAEFDNSYSRMLAVERALTLEYYTSQAHESTAIDRLRAFALNETSSSDWLHALEMGYQALGRADPHDPRAHIDVSAIPNESFFKPRDFHDYFNGFDRYRIHAISVQTHFDAARLLLAITLYEREIGRPPRALADLVPDYLPSLPQDPYAPDKQFRYRLLPPLEANQRHSRFTLYSVGYDAIDNNATPPGPDTKDPLAPLHSDKLPNTDAIFHPRPTRPR